MSMWEKYVGQRLSGEYALRGNLCQSLDFGDAGDSENWSAAQIQIPSLSWPFEGITV